jgi:hypothetical protein
VRWLPWKKRQVTVNVDDQMAAAEREVETSRRGLRETQEKVVKPLNAYAAENNFANLIADSLARGYRRGTAK